MRFQLIAGILLLLQAQNTAAQQSVGGAITSSNTTDGTTLAVSLAASSASISQDTSTFSSSSSTLSSVFTNALSLQEATSSLSLSTANSTSESSFLSSSSTSSSSSSSLVNTSRSTSSSSSIAPISRTNISTLPSSTSQFSSLSTSSHSSTTASSSSSSSSDSPSTTAFSFSSSTSAVLSTYTSDGQVIVTQVYLTLTSTHTSFSTSASNNHSLSAKNKKIVIGVVVGVGVPVLILLGWIIYFFLIRGKKQTYIDSQGRVVIDIKRNKFVKYVWCDLFGFSFKSERTESGGSQRESGLKRRGSKTSSSNAGASGVLGDGVMQMNDDRLERENALLKEQREKGFPTSDEYDGEKSSHSASNSQEPGRDIDGNVMGRNSVNTHRRMESVISGDGFDYLDEINAKKY